MRGKKTQIPIKSGMTFNEALKKCLNTKPVRTKKKPKNETAEPTKRGK